MNKRVVFGLPLNPAPLLDQLTGHSFCVSYAHRARLGKQLDQAIDLVDDDGILLVDNGAFTAWQQGTTMDWDYWEGFAVWANDILERCPQAVAVVPDVIGGTVEQNAELIDDFLGCGLIDTDRCMPVWHMHEPLDWLRHLASSWFYVAIGSSGPFAKVGTPKWHKRMRLAFRAMDRATTLAGERRPWVHLMRAQSEMHLYPVDSCDSCNVAVNHGRFRKRNPAPGHVARAAQPVLDRVDASCDGGERRMLLPPAAELAEAREWSGRMEELNTRQRRIYANAG